MLTTYHTLRYLASTLHSILAGSSVTEIFAQQKDELVLVFDGDQRHHLVVSCKTDATTCYLHPTFARARRNTVDLLRKAIGTTVQTVTILPADRVIHIEFAGGCLIALILYGPKSNVFLVGADRTITDAFRSPYEYRGKPYTPEAKDPVYDFPLFLRRLGESPDTPVLVILKKVFPSLGSTLLREILFRADLDETAQAGTIDGNQAMKITGTIQGILQEIDSPLPRLYYADDGTPVLFSLIPLRHAASYREEVHRDISEAIRIFVTRRKRSKDLNEKKSKLLARLRHQIEKTHRTIAAAEKEYSEADRAAEYQQWGTLLLGQPPGNHATSLTLDTDSGPVTIPLDARHSVTQNAQQYFQRARRARLAREQADLRLPSLRSRIAAAETLAELLETAQSVPELDAMTKAHADTLDAFGLGPKSAERQAIPFRIFTVNGGYEVWTGKSSANNDLLTMKYAKPGDLWFHARGSSGSHVILRCPPDRGQPGKRAREQAASIAAYYSRMKTAGTVPVAMTQRKYVRKPKGSPPGTVVIERETVLFVKPGLPASQREHDE